MLCLAAAALLSACISRDAVRVPDYVPAWLQDDNAIPAPGALTLEDA
ncbi:hypothetical protein [Dongia sedimenti]|uniref:Uncharacterized protein n=1 Tax=Dongia sedimenti TaxID=3064282 RepID=A0ABU0YQI8_9PROT|nr:hypothetical protein [Rhodospirillaceae bacterium R-7]